MTVKSFGKVPGSTSTHILNLLQAEGYTVIACLAVNDPFVMAAWGEDVKASGKVSEKLVSKTFVLLS